MVSTKVSMCQEEWGRNVYFVLYGFRYGYVDNHPNIQEESAIDIDWAIDKEGNKADSLGIDENLQMG